MIYFSSLNKIINALYPWRMNMSSIIKKTTFEDLYNTFSGVLNRIDKLLIEAKEKNPDNIFEGHKNLKMFFQAIERQAIKETSVELGISDSSTRERWKVMSLPHPFYDAIESGEVSYSKVKPLIVLNFDPEGDKDIEASEKIVERIQDLHIKEIRDVAQEELNEAGVWNESDIVIRRLAEQCGITD